MQGLKNQCVVRKFPQGWGDWEGGVESQREKEELLPATAQRDRVQLHRQTSSGGGE